MVAKRPRLRSAVQQLLLLWGERVARFARGHDSCRAAEARVARHRSGHRPTTGRATSSKAAGWIHVEGSALATKQFLRLVFGKPHLGHFCTGVEQFSLLSPSG